MKFLKNGELALVNGGYLVEKAGETPYYHKAFVKLQQEAHYLVNLANTVRATDFEVKSPVTFEQVVATVKEKLNTERREFVIKPEKVSTPTTDKLQKEALDWLNGKKEDTKVDKLNRILQKFAVLAEFEEFGLYFEQSQIVKLNELYSLKQIIEAVTTLEPHLD
tara:strand:+ start:24394 stop:24885 length:492 start_codon:yes stop_codon:yes gene_type:complete